MSCHVVSCHVMSCHVMSCHVMSWRLVTWRLFLWQRSVHTQGDEEAKLQLPVTPMCDRRSVIVSTNQLRFIQFLLKVMHNLCCTACLTLYMSQYGFVEWNIFCMSTLMAMNCSMPPISSLALYVHHAHQCDCICYVITPLLNVSDACLPLSIESTISAVYLFYLTGVRYDDVSVHDSVSDAFIIVQKSSHVVGSCATYLAMHTRTTTINLPLLPTMCCMLPKCTCVQEHCMCFSWIAGMNET